MTCYTCERVEWLLAILYLRSGKLNFYSVRNIVEWLLGHYKVIGYSVSDRVKWLLTYSSVTL